MVINSQELQDVIRQLSGGIKNAPARAPLPSPPPLIQKAMRSAQEDAVGVARLVSLTYRSLSGNEKDRDVLIRRVIHNRQDLYIDGLAMDIRAPRLIKVGNIAQVRDTSSGWIYDDPYQFLHDKLGIADPRQKKAPPLEGIARIAEQMGEEITVLIYLVALDGRRHREERLRVIEYIKERLPGISVDDQELHEHLISLAPDEETFRMALEKALKKDKETVQLLVAAMFKVSMADSSVHDKERAFILRIIELLEKDGMHFTLPLSF